MEWWAARDESGAQWLQIFNSEPKLKDGFFHAEDEGVRVSNSHPKLPEIKPGEKVKAKLTIEILED